MPHLHEAVGAPDMCARDLSHPAREGLLCACHCTCHCSRENEGEAGARQHADMVRGAAQAGDADIVELLLLEGVPLPQGGDLPQGPRHSPMYYACESGSEAVLDTLGADTARTHIHAVDALGV